jgi:hypothetical protein
MTDFGIFGTSGFAREAGDIAHALGLRPHLYSRRNAEERNAWTSPDEVVLQSELGASWSSEVRHRHWRQQDPTTASLRTRQHVAFGNLIHP